MSKIVGFLISPSNSEVLVTTSGRLPSMNLQSYHVRDTAVDMEQENHRQVLYKEEATNSIQRVTAYLKFINQHHHNKRRTIPQQKILLN